MKIYYTLLLLIIVVLIIIILISKNSHEFGLLASGNTSLNNMNNIYEGMINIGQPEPDTINKFKKNKKKYLWTYWELINGAQKPPDYIDLCIDIMKKNSKKYFKLVILNEKSIFNYLPDLRRDINNLPIALKADYIRIALLYRYGGFWMDPDTIMMTDLKKIVHNLNKKNDFIGFGCTGQICKNLEGYGRPSNGVMGSIKKGKLISYCLQILNEQLNMYYETPMNKRKKFAYFDLGKKTIWKSYDKLIREDPSYNYYHVNAWMDGTRNKTGEWIAPELIFDNNIEYYDKNELQVVMLANSIYCGNDKKYNWFCKLSRSEIIGGQYFISSLFRDALKFEV